MSHEKFLLRFMTDPISGLWKIHETNHLTFFILALDSFISDGSESAQIYETNSDMKKVPACSLSKLIFNQKVFQKCLFPALIIDHNKE